MNRQHVIKQAKTNSIYFLLSVDVKINITFQENSKDRGLYKDSTFKRIEHKIIWKTKRKV